MNCYNNYNKIVCPKCQSEQIEITMRRGYTYYYCINCGTYINFDGTESIEEW